jgi:4-hydroxybenzoate polyprenyltransferase
MKRITTLLQLLRVYQWTKNLLVFAPLLFAHQLHNPQKILLALQAFVAFCCAASATYIINDYWDRERDRTHPRKRHRPLASGAVSTAFALTVSALLFIAAGLFAYGLPLGFGFCLGAYVVLTFLYSVRLKDVLLVDVIVIALGFVIRALAGALALQVTFSNWLVVCTLFLALFLGLAKRRHEITLLEAGASDHREVLQHYSVAFLDQLILIVASAAILTYAIYTCAPEVVQRIGTDKLYLTLPFVVYGLFRYLYLIHHKTGGGDPSSTLLQDVPMIITVVGWGLACALILYWREIYYAFGYMTAQP